MRIRVVEAQVGERRHATRPSLGKPERQRFTRELERRVAPPALQTAPQSLEKTGVVRRHVLSLFVEKGADGGDARYWARKFGQQRRDHRSRRGFPVGASHPDAE